VPAFNNFQQTSFELRSGWLFWTSIPESHNSGTFTTIYMPVKNNNLKTNLNYILFMHYRCELRAANEHLNFFS